MSIDKHLADDVKDYQTLNLITDLAGMRVFYIHWVLLHLDIFY